LKKLKDVASDGDILKTLEALRDLLAERLDECDSNRDIAALSRQFAQTCESIEAIKKERAENRVSSIDDFRARLKVAK